MFTPFSLKNKSQSALCKHRFNSLVILVRTGQQLLNRGSIKDDTSRERKKTEEDAYKASLIDKV